MDFFFARYFCHCVIQALALLVSITTNTYTNTYTEECHVSNGWGFFFY